MAGGRRTVMAGSCKVDVVAVAEAEADAAGLSVSEAASV